MLVRLLVHVGSFRSAEFRVPDSCTLQALLELVARECGEACTDLAVVRGRTEQVIASEGDWQAALARHFSAATAPAITVRVRRTADKSGAGRAQAHLSSCLAELTLAARAGACRVPAHQTRAGVAINYRLDDELSPLCDGRSGLRTGLDTSTGECLLVRVIAPGDVLDGGSECDLTGCIERALARLYKLSSPHLVPYLGGHEVLGEIRLLMPFVEARVRTPARRTGVREAVAGLLGAVHTLHDAGLAHGRIGHECIAYTASGTLVLLDYGPGALCDEGLALALGGVRVSEHKLDRFAADCEAVVRLTRELAARSGRVSREAEAFLRKATAGERAASPWNLLVHQPCIEELASAFCEYWLASSSSPSAAKR